MATVTHLRTTAARSPVRYRPLLTPAEVAGLFGVDRMTVTRWADSGKLSSIRTLGNHRRFYEDDVLLLLAERS
jgi:excisionase family DNA binding protein